MDMTDHKEQILALDYFKIFSIERNLPSCTCSYRAVIFLKPLELYHPRTARWLSIVATICPIAVLKFQKRGG